MNELEQLKQELATQQRHWLVTGGAGFIGSHLCGHLLEAGQQVTVIDNFSTGSSNTIDWLRERAPSEEHFTFKEASIVEPVSLEEVIPSVDVVLHQAALGSVPRSMKDPCASHESNVTGFLMVLDCCRRHGKPLVYASSSSVYGDDSSDIKTESVTGNVLSPYAATKKMNELYAATYARSYKYHSIGLRYFNVFGPRQNPNGPYAAVIPCWIDALLSGKEAFINGDGKTSRDFCYVDNVVFANVRAALSLLEGSESSVLNISAGGNTSLTQLFTSIVDALKSSGCALSQEEAIYRDFRPGDIRHSCASVDKAAKSIGYTVLFQVDEGLSRTVQWYLEHR